MAKNRNRYVTIGQNPEKPLELGGKFYSITNNINNTFGHRLWADEIGLKSGVLSSVKAKILKNKDSEAGTLPATRETTGKLLVNFVDPFDETNALTLVPVDSNIRSNANIGFPIIPVTRTAEDSSEVFDSFYITTDESLLSEGTISKSDSFYQAKYDLENTLIYEKPNTFDDGGTKKFDSVRKLSYDADDKIFVQKRFVEPYTPYTESFSIEDIPSPLESSEDSDFYYETIDYDIKENYSLGKQREIKITLDFSSDDSVDLTLLNTQMTFEQYKDFIGLESTNFRGDSLHSTRSFNFLKNGGSIYSSHFLPTAYWDFANSRWSYLDGVRMSLIGNTSNVTIQGLPISDFDQIEYAYLGGLNNKSSKFNIQRSFNGPFNATTSNGIYTKQLENSFLNLCNKPLLTTPGFRIDGSLIKNNTLESEYNKNAISKITSSYGFPYKVNWQPRSQNLINMKDYLASDFLLEKIVVKGKFTSEGELPIKKGNFSTSYQSAFSSLLDRDDDSYDEAWNYDVFNEVYQMKDDCLHNGNRYLSNAVTFFILNERKGLNYIKNNIPINQQQTYTLLDKETIDNISIPLNSTLVTTGKRLENYLGDFKSYENIRERLVVTSQILPNNYFYDFDEYSNIELDSNFYLDVTSGDEEGKEFLKPILSKNVFYYIENYDAEDTASNILDSIYIEDGADYEGGSINWSENFKFDYDITNVHPSSAPEERRTFSLKLYEDSNDSSFNQNSSRELVTYANMLILGKNENIEIDEDVLSNIDYKHELNFSNNEDVILSVNSPTEFTLKSSLRNINKSDYTDESIYKIKSNKKEKNILVEQRKSSVVDFALDSWILGSGIETKNPDDVTQLPELIEKNIYNLFNFVNNAETNQDDMMFSFLGLNIENDQADVYRWLVLNESISPEFGKSDQDANNVSPYIYLRQKHYASLNLKVKDKDALEDNTHYFCRINFKFEYNNENVFEGDPNFDGPYSYSWHNSPVRSSSFISDAANIFNFITYIQSADGTDVIFNLRFLDTFESASSYDSFFRHGLENISNINELSSSFLFNLPDPDDTSNLIFNVDSNYPWRGNKDNFEEEKRKYVCFLKFLYYGFLYAPITVTEPLIGGGKKAAGDTLFSSGSIIRIIKNLGAFEGRDSSKYRINLSINKGINPNNGEEIYEVSSSSLGIEFLEDLENDTLTGINSSLRTSKNFYTPVDGESGFGFFTPASFGLADGNYIINFGIDQNLDGVATSKLIDQQLYYFNFLENFRGSAPVYQTEEYYNINNVLEGKNLGEPNNLGIPSERIIHTNYSDSKKLTADAKSFSGKTFKSAGGVDNIKKTTYLLKPTDELVFGVSSNCNGEVAPTVVKLHDKIEITLIGRDYKDSKSIKTNESKSIRKVVVGDNYIKKQGSYIYDLEGSYNDNVWSKNSLLNSKQEFETKKVTGLKSSNKFGSYSDFVVLDKVFKKTGSKNTIVYKSDSVNPSLANVFLNCTNKRPLYTVDSLDRYVYRKNLSYKKNFRLLEFPQNFISNIHENLNEPGSYKLVISDSIKSDRIESYPDRYSNILYDWHETFHLHTYKDFFETNKSISETSYSILKNNIDGSKFNIYFDINSYSAGLDYEDYESFLKKSKSNNDSLIGDTWDTSKFETYSGEGWGYSQTISSLGINFSFKKEFDYGDNLNRHYKTLKTYLLPFSKNMIIQSPIEIKNNNDRIGNIESKKYISSDKLITKTLDANSSVTFDRYTIQYMLHDIDPEYCDSSSDVFSLLYGKENKEYSSGWCLVVEPTIEQINTLINENTVGEEINRYFYNDYNYIPIDPRVDVANNINVNEDYHASYKYYNTEISITLSQDASGNSSIYDVVKNFKLIKKEDLRDGSEEQGGNPGEKKYWLVSPLYFWETREFYLTHQDYDNVGTSIDSLISQSFFNSNNEQSNETDKWLNFGFGRRDYLSNEFIGSNNLYKSQSGHTHQEDDDQAAWYAKLQDKNDTSGARRSIGRNSSTEGHRKVYNEFIIFNTNLIATNIGNIYLRSVIDEPDLASPAYEGSQTSEFFDDFTGIIPISDTDLIASDPAWNNSFYHPIYPIRRKINITGKPSELAISGISDDLMTLTYITGSTSTDVKISFLDKNAKLVPLTWDELKFSGTSSSCAIEDQLYMFPTSYINGYQTKNENADLFDNDLLIEENKGYFIDKNYFNNNISILKKRESLGLDNILNRYGSTYDNSFNVNEKIYSSNCKTISNNLLFDTSYDFVYKIKHLYMSGYYNTVETPEEQDFYKRLKIVDLKGIKNNFTLFRKNKICESELIYSLDDSKKIRLSENSLFQNKEKLNSKNIPYFEIDLSSSIIKSEFLTDGDKVKQIPCAHYKIDYVYDTNLGDSYTEPTLTNSAISEADGSLRIESIDNINLGSPIYRLDSNPEGYDSKEQQEEKIKDFFYGFSREKNNRFPIKRLDGFKYGVDSGSTKSMQVYFKSNSYGNFSDKLMGTVNYCTITITKNNTNQYNRTVERQFVNSNFVYIQSSEATLTYNTDVYCRSNYPYIENENHSLSQWST